MSRAQFFYWGQALAWIVAIVIVVWFATKEGEP